MKLIGTYLSPYARRVAAALISRGMPFDHEAVNGYRQFEIASRWTAQGDTIGRGSDHRYRSGGIPCADESRFGGPSRNPRPGRACGRVSRRTAFRADKGSSLRRMEASMTDRIALIAGVGGATGAALSRRFAQGGYRVAMIARNAERLAELETQIPRARGYPCDVTNLDRLGEIVERVQTELGAPHVLVHNAVAATFAGILDASVEDLERNFQ